MEDYDSGWDAAARYFRDEVRKLRSWTLHTPHGLEEVEGKIVPREQGDRHYVRQEDVLKLFPPL